MESSASEADDSWVTRFDILKCCAIQVLALDLEMNSVQ